MKTFPYLIDFCVIFISFAKKPQTAMNVTDTHEKNAMRAKEIGVVHGYSKKCFQYMLVLNRISVNDSLPLPLCRALVDYCI